MSYPPRWFEPDVIYFITTRTVNRTLLLRPSADLNQIIGGALAVAQERHGIRVFDYVAMSNHLHLAVQSPDGQIPAFMRDLKARIALEINRRLGRQGPVFSRRYNAAPIIDDEAQLDRALYIWSHGVKEGLVDRAEEWPGVASVKERLGGSQAIYTIFDRTAWFWDQRRSVEPVDQGRHERRVRIELSDWPFLETLSSAEERRARVAVLTEQARLTALEKRGGRSALGVAAVLAQWPHSTPRDSHEHRPNPLCHASTRSLRQGYRELRRAFVEKYRAASLAFRQGYYEVLFPEHAYRPPLPPDWGPVPGLPPLAVPT